MIQGRMRRVDGIRGRVVSGVETRGKERVKSQTGDRLVEGNQEKEGRRLVRLDVCTAVTCFFAWRRDIISEQDRMKV